MCYSAQESDLFVRALYCFNFRNLLYLFVHTSCYFIDQGVNVAQGMYGGIQMFRCVVEFVTIDILFRCICSWAVYRDPCVALTHKCPGVQRGYRFP